MLKKEVRGLSFCLGDELVMNNYERKLIFGNEARNIFAEDTSNFDFSLSAAVAHARSLNETMMHQFVIAGHSVDFFPQIEFSIDKSLLAEREKINFYDAFSHRFLEEDDFIREPLVNFKSCFVGSLACAKLPLIIEMRRASNKINSCFSEHSILTEKLWEAEALKLERMDFMYKEVNEDEVYSKKLKGKFNPSGRTMKQHFNILQLNKQNKRGF